MKEKKNHMIGLALLSLSISQICKRVLNFLLICSTSNFATKKVDLKNFAISNFYTIVLEENSTIQNQQ